MPGRGLDRPRRPVLGSSLNGGGVDPDVVHFTTWEPAQNMRQKAADLYEAGGVFDVIAEGDLVAVKLHVGELGNPNYVRPFFVKQVVDAVAARGGRPFLTDTSTYYLVQRSNAVDHMNTALTHGFGFAPFIVADGLAGENAVAVDSPGTHLEAVEVAGAIHRADAMVVVSHVKGHPLGGFGGAIKNLAMGCTSKRTKLAQHRLVGIEVDSELCQGCGACVEACRHGLARVEDDLAAIDHPECMRCLACATACPEGAIAHVGRENLGLGLAWAAAGVMSAFAPGKVAFINFINDVTVLCDCLPVPSERIGPDVGIMTGFSPLSIDAASLARIDYQRLNDIHRTDCRTQITTLAGLKVPGRLDPALIEV
ncbi:MAG: DUF362 domain-containing protein [Proteobacteria bacterium]|nr:DUF362 domain-containing protein [Pseudomonadota bacterium]MBU1742127.1 DUF362 domain-containing protein [Pseudomonadota bacterium]